MHFDIEKELIQVLQPTHHAPGAFIATPASHSCYNPFGGTIMFVADFLRNSVRLVCAVFAALAFFMLVYGVLSVAPSLIHWDLSEGFTVIIALVLYIPVVEDIIDQYPPRMMARITEELMGWIRWTALILTVEIVILGIRSY